jgi:hypothetical protein
MAEPSAYSFTQLIEVTHCTSSNSSDIGLRSTTTVALAGGSGNGGRGLLDQSDLVLELVALDDGVGARDGVAAGGPEVEGARVALRVPVHAAEGGAAPAREARQAHALPAARAPPARRRGRGVGRGRGRDRDRDACLSGGSGGGGRLEGRRGRLLPVAVALGAEVQRGGAAEEAAVVGAQAVAVLPPLLLRHGVGAKQVEREACFYAEVWNGIQKAWRKSGRKVRGPRGWSLAFV